MAMETRVLLTGGAGFIGSNLVLRLVAEGFTVRVLDNFSTGFRENLAEALKEVELIEGDLRDPQAAARAVAGVDTVFHLGALGSVSRSVDDPMTSHTVNADGTLNILLAARAAGVRRVVYSSSSSVYGDNPALPKKESLATQPISPYAVSKLAAENYCRAFWQVYGLETIALRYFNVFGPRQNPYSQYAAVIPRFIDRVRRGQPPVIQGDGEQRRDFTYVANVVEANLLAMRATEGFGQAFNIACGDQISVRRLADGIIALLERDLEPVYTAPRPGDIRDSLADVSKATRFLGYQPVVDFWEGLRRTVAWHCAGNVPLITAGTVKEA